jgi:hypothetical protein
MATRLRPRNKRPGIVISSDAPPGQKESGKGMTNFRLSAPVVNTAECNSTGGWHPHIHDRGRPTTLAKGTIALLTFALALSLAAPVAASVTTAASASPIAGPGQATSAAPRLAVGRKYANCAALHRRYPHGVGRRGARDHVSGNSKPVTTFSRNNVAYNANRRLDRDRDGIACERL